ncbi:hypothetical protein MUN89_07620 [Halobacillus salinarum]|uniref:Uncharacterized protein n=1 Tax=Halobacillus salinarum TaxID=2932257 RepID=A0ABY4EMV3_9BACI|nr:hypothetical protein [Halobacillus salinarum]UOQ45787.1 hypothetical protein MUN89_07620 [Halobacillus salinarum]
MVNKSLKITSNIYNLLLSLGAFYTGITMLSGKGVFASFPDEWMGKVPFNNWASLAVFAIILFGFGNAAVSIYGFIKKEANLFLFTIIMGTIFLGCNLIQLILLKEWYLATVEFMLFSFVQLLLGSLGFITNNSNQA